MLKKLMALSQPALLALPPEKAHEVTLRSIEAGLFPSSGRKDHPLLKQNMFGLEFSNPIGMAAGFDKNARVPNALIKGGFGYSEIGTVTPQPQSGNPSPRVFRLIRDKGLINRLGFNNEGHETALKRLENLGKHEGPIGVNIGANKNSRDRISDYVTGLQKFYHLADYFTVNISSPNTPGLRDMQGPEVLAELLSRIQEQTTILSDKLGQKRPLLVKFAPDIADDDVQPIVDTALKFGIDGIIVSNTTLARDHVQHNSVSGEAGGLSGKPVFNRSTRMLGRFYKAVGGAIPLIGVGGIHSAETALEKIKAGASLLQLYTGLIYQGPMLLDEMKDELVGACQKNNSNLDSLTGSKADEWAQLEI